MAGPAALAVVLSASTLLCLYLLLLLTDPPATSPAVAVLHRRSGRHYTPFRHAISFGPFATELEPLFRGATGGEKQRRRCSAVPDIGTFHETLDRLPDWSHFDAELGPLDRYLGPDGELDVRERLLYLFPMLDRAPRDGGVSLAELEAWLRRRAADRLDALSRRELERHDMDGDGAVTLREYLAVDDADHQHIDIDLQDWSSKEQGRPGWWLHKFSAADTDQSGAMDAAELNDFLHPEDSSQEKVQLWLLMDKLSEMDRDRDGRLSLDEFISQSHRIDHNSVANDPGCSEAEKKFRQLDSNTDGHLTVEEAPPVIQSLISGEFSYAKSHAKLLMKADDDKDNKLSLEEMLNHYISFYNIVYMDDQHDYDDIGNNSHDELR